MLLLQRVTIAPADHAQMKGDCTCRRCAPRSSTPADHAQMKGDCTDQCRALCGSDPADHAQMKGDCTNRTMSLSVSAYLQTTLK